MNQKNPFKVLDLFSGIGGFSLGLERAGMETIAFCEIEPFCQQVLKKHWPDVPLFKDIKTLTANDLKEKPDILVGGYPCQPFSVAGKQRGQTDDRHLWPEMFRLIKECRPTWVIAENVAGHVRMGLDQVLFDLESEGYLAQPFVIPACAVNAQHRRDRVWIIGHTECDGSPAFEKRRGSGEDHQRRQEGENQTLQSEGAGQPECSGEVPAGCHASNADLSGRRQVHEEVAGESSKQLDCLRVQSPEDDTNASSNRLQRSAEKPLSGFTHIQGELTRSGSVLGIIPDPSQPGICGTAHGFPGRAHRIKALGNAVVPHIPEIIGRAIVAIANGHKKL